MKKRLMSLALCGLFLLAGCQNQAVQEEIWELEQDDVIVFADGEAADRWRGYQNGLREPWALYELSDGTVLLQENDLSGPEGSAAFAALSEEVQAAVSAWYQGEGARYDLTALLEECYARYQEQGGENYQPGLVAQTASATAASEDVVYLTTLVEQAADPAAGQTLRYGAAFDRASGQRLEVWSLFTPAGGGSPAGPGRRRGGRPRGPAAIGRRHRPGAHPVLRGPAGDRLPGGGLLKGWTPPTP